MRFVFCTSLMVLAFAGIGFNHAYSLDYTSKGSVSEKTDIEKPAKSKIFVTKDDLKKKKLVTSAEEKKAEEEPVCNAEDIALIKEYNAKFKKFDKAVKDDKEDLFDVVDGIKTDAGAGKVESRGDKLRSKISDFYESDFYKKASVAHKNCNVAMKQNQIIIPYGLEWIFGDSAAVSSE